MNSDIKEITEFLVIDVDTSYNALLGRPWVHDHHIVPSTYHQCVKYSWIGRQGRIVADNDPFNGASAYYADARFHIKAVLPKDTEKEKEAVKGESSEKRKRYSKEDLPICPSVPKKRTHNARSNQFID